MAEPYPNEFKPLLVERGIVKFPVNIHGIYVEKRDDGFTILTAKQNDVKLEFVIDDDACGHLAALLTASDPVAGGHT